jgi:hypothetical protein
MRRRPLGNGRLPGQLLEPLHTWHQSLGIPEVQIDAAINASGKPTGGWHAARSPLPCRFLRIAEPVKDAYDAYNDGLLQLIINGDAPADLEACYGRLHDKAIRVAMLLAAFAGHDTITMPYWAYAQGVAEQWRLMLHHSIAMANEGQPLTREEQLEQKLESLLARYARMTARDLHRYLKGFSSIEINRSVTALLHAGRVLETPVGRTKVYELPLTETSPEGNEIEEPDNDVPF